jgi:hypothetical protein
VSAADEAAQPGDGPSDGSEGAAALGEGSEGGTSAEPVLRLDPEARARVTRRSLVALGGATVAVGVLALALQQGGRADLAVAVVLGHLLGQGITLTWVAGALWTWSGGHSALMVGTVGAFPLRMLLLVVGVGVAHLQELHMGGVVFSILATQALGHVIEGYAFVALADATRAEVDAGAGDEQAGAPPVTPAEE